MSDKGYRGLAEAMFDGDPTTHDLEARSLGSVPQADRLEAIRVQ